MGDVGQVTTELDCGVDPLFVTPDELDDRLLVQQDGRIRLLGGYRRGGAVCTNAVLELTESRSGQAHQLPVSSDEDPAACKQFCHRYHELVGVDCVGKHAVGSVRHEVSNNGVGVPFAHLVRFDAGHVGEWHEVALWGPQGEFDLHDEHVGHRVGRSRARGVTLVPRRVGHRHRVHDGRSRHRPDLLRKPAAALEVGGECRLQSLSIGPLEDGVPPVSDGECRRDPRGVVGLTLQEEPVGPVRSQRDEVGELADRRELQGPRELELVPRHEVTRDRVRRTGHGGKG